MKSLENIVKKYSTLKSEDNYNLGGGLFCLFTYWFIIEDLVKKIKSRK